MPYIFWFAVFGITLLVGLVFGFNLAVIFLQEQQQLTNTGIALAVVSFIGVGISAFGLIRTWNKDRKEEAKTPVLAFDGFISTEETIDFGQFAGYIVRTIAVRVKMTKGMGRAQQCEGFISIPETKIPASASPWLHERIRYLDIGGEAFLTLFQLDRVPDNTGAILSFISAQNSIAQTRLPRETFDLSKLRIELHSANAKNPPAIEKPIAEIINEARIIR